MIRSGTTYLTKLLNESNNISAISDPYLHFFKSYRNEVYKKYLTEFDNNFPLDDHFCSKFEKINEIIEKSNFSETVKINNLNEIILNIKSQAQRDSKNVLKNIEKITANNYGDLLNKLFLQIQKNYFKKNLNYVGFKSTFCEQFTNTLENQNKNYKFIFIIRDPRAVYASHINEHEKQYPILFIIRNWRKSVFYALNNHKKENTIILNYENLVKNKKNNLINVFKFLGVNYKNYDFNKKFFKSDNKDYWLSNSSFSNLNYNNEMPLWKNKLTEEQISLIESMTYHELKYFNYEVNIQRKITDINLKNIENSKLFYEWIKEYSKKNYILNNENLKNELKRNQLIKDKEKLNGELRKRFLISNQICKNQNY